jgi:hypothetical protein
MKNPLKPDRSDRERDNPLVPNAIERPVERAADRAATHDNPLVPNAIERPVERAAADDVARGRDAARPPVVERPLRDERPDHRQGIMDHPSASQGGVTTSATDHSRQIDLFPNEELVGYRTQWESIQTGFVDQPRAAVEQADALVSQLVTRLTEVFTRERSTLEEQWTKGDHVSTEELRIALTRYRSFFHRLLSM